MKISHTTTWTHINQYKTDKQNFKKNIRDIDKKNTR